MDTSAQWPQGIGINVKQVDNSPQVANNNNKAGAAARPPKDQQALNCPRCNSTNTKFCYYNNYSLSQPRYFCKTCRRYWTNGGSLRNVPVGGGSRKNKRSSSNNNPISSNSPNAIISSANKKLNVLPDLNPPSFSSGQDLNLAYNPSSHHHHQLMNGFVHNLNPTNNDPTSSTTSHLPIMEFLKTGGGSLSSFMSVNPVSDHASSMFDQFKPSLGFSLDGINNDNNGYNVNHASRISPFPFEELKPPPVSTTSDQFEHHHQDNREANGYWNGLLTGGGGSW